jgi:hypothetical protein
MTALFSKGKQKPQTGEWKEPMCQLACLATFHMTNAIHAHGGYSNRATMMMPFWTTAQQMKLIVLTSAHACQRYLRTNQIAKWISQK